MLLIYYRDAAGKICDYMRPPAGWSNTRRAKGQKTIKNTCIIAGQKGKCNHENGTDFSDAGKFQVP